MANRSMQAKNLKLRRLMVKECNDVRYRIMSDPLNPDNDPMVIQRQKSYRNHHKDYMALCQKINNSKPKIRLAD